MRLNWSVRKSLTTSTWKSKPGKWPKGCCMEVFNRHISSIFEGFLSMVLQFIRKNKPLKTKDKNGLFTIEWEQQNPG